MGHYLFLRYNWGKQIKYGHIFEELQQVNKWKNFNYNISS